MDIGTCYKKVLEKNFHASKELSFVKEINLLFNIAKKSSNLNLEKQEFLTIKENPKGLDILGMCSSESSLSSQVSNYSTGIYIEIIDGPLRLQKSHGTYNILNKKLITKLNKCQISERNAVRIIAVVAEACGVDIIYNILNKKFIIVVKKYVKNMLKKYKNAIMRYCASLGR
ncbi:hypothetical protein ABEB36_014627 [Hypothenemus hampei]|uniref:Uncharacterized protein n=1 Tax=Hypothenemus hampei TaxID=57062 RepID=A0ABD1E2D2_HYPHA